jgi:hypothetical protein
MSTQPKPALTVAQWQQAAKQALAHVAEKPRELRGRKGRANSKQYSVRRLIWELADEILALNAKGISYRDIAEQLTEEGIPISDNVLRGYISSYRKQKGQLLTAQKQQLSARERLKNSLANNHPIR